MTTTAWRALAGKPWTFWASRWPALALLYLVASAVLGVILLPLAVITFFLIPLWALAAGSLERRRVHMLGFARIESAHVRIDRSQRHNWLGIRMTETATWREAGSLLITLILGWIALALLFFEGLALAGVVAAVVAAVHGPMPVTLFGDVRFDLMPNHVWMICLAGVFLLAVLPYVNALLAAGQASLARVLLAPRDAELARNVERLTRSRISLVAAFEQERRRIERDLHDGVQQELVALSLKLGLAELDLGLAERAGADVGEARAAVAAAHDHAEHALATLRATVRGIHPAVLSDHGLEAALAELSGRAGLPVVLDASVGRLDAAAEACAYFTASEAVTNAVKHSRATSVTITARTSTARTGSAGTGASNGETMLTLAVTDNGRGGADPAGGTGLQGLAERAETLGGNLRIDSPVGGPTTLLLTLPVQTGPQTNPGPPAQPSLPASNIS